MERMDARERQQSPDENRDDKHGQQQQVLALQLVPDDTLSLGHHVRHRCTDRQPQKGLEPQDKMIGHIVMAQPCGIIAADAECGKDIEQERDNQRHDNPKPVDDAKHPLRGQTHQDVWQQEPGEFAVIPPPAQEIEHNPSRAVVKSVRVHPSGNPKDKNQQNDPVGQIQLERTFQQVAPCHPPLFIDTIQAVTAHDQEIQDGMRNGRQR